MTVAGKVNRVRHTNDNLRHDGRGRDNTKNNTRFAWMVEAGSAPVQVEVVRRGIHNARIRRSLIRNGQTEKVKMETLFAFHDSDGNMI